MQVTVVRGVEKVPFLVVILFMRFIYLLCQVTICHDPQTSFVQPAADALAVPF